MSIFDYEKSDQSENGEDGIINYIFEKLNIKSGVYLDIGSNGGIHNSNTFMLFKKKWEGYYIESNKYIIKDLIENFKKYENKIRIINNDLIISKENLLQELLENEKINYNKFDLINIKYLNFEYELFKSLNKYRAKVLCIYINPVIDPFEEMEIKNKNKFCKNLYFWDKIAKENNYFILVFTGFLILIDDLYKPLFKNFVKDIKTLYSEYLINLPFEKLESLNYQIIEDTEVDINNKNKELQNYYNKKNNKNTDKKVIKNIDEEIFIIEKSLFIILNSLKNIKDLQKEALE